MGHHQRNKTEHHRQHGHQDGAQTNLCRAICRLCQCHAFRPSLTGIFGQQNGGLGKQSDNHNQSGLHIDVVLQSEQPREQEAAHQSARYGQQHGKGDEHALVEGAQYQVYQDHAEHEYQCGIVGGLALLARQTSEFIAASGEKHLMCRLANRLDDLAGAVARCRRTVDGDSIEKVEARKVGRSVGLGQAHELAQRCHVAIGSTHVHLVKRLCIYTVLRRCLHSDVIEFGETVEVRYIQPGVIPGERGKHIGRGHARLLAFCGINIHPILGIVSGKG